MTNLLILLVVGKVSIFFIQKFPVEKVLIRLRIGREFLKELISCDLCLGVYVYWVWSAIMGLVFFREVYYVPIISQLITGAICSLGMHLMSIGWSDKFGTIVVE